jgi:GAF domain-containing protein/DNA-binding NarL/FixJ family response regulator
LKRVFKDVLTMRKLLLVDDDPFSQKMLEDMFRNEWKIINETTIEQITKRLGAETFHLILLNASLRRTDGEMMFDAMHEHSPHLPIITYTTASQARLGRALLRKGAFWNMTMPLNTDDLSHVMGIVRRIEEYQEQALATRNDFIQLEEGIARMFTPLKDNFPEKFTFEEDELIQGILELLADILQVDKTSLMLLNPETQELRIKAAKGLTPYVIQNSVRKVGEGIAGWVAKEGKPLLIKDVQHDEQFSESAFFHQYTTKSLVCVPLKLGDRVIGVLSANNHLSGKPFDEKDLYLATIFSHLLMLTIQNAQLQFNREKFYKREREIGNLSRKITATLEPKALFHILLTECSSVFQAESVFLFNLEDKGPDLSVYYVSGTKFEEVALPPQQIRPWLAQRKEPALVSAESSRKEFDLLKTLTGIQFACWASSPIIFHDKLVGSLELASTDPNRFKEQDLQLLIRTSQQACLAMNNAHLYMKLLNSIREISDARKEVERVRRGQFL